MLTAWLCLQNVKEGCIAKGSCNEDVILLPFDLLAPFEKLEGVTEQANEAFGGSGVDYLVHNAGEAGVPCCLCMSRAQ